MYRDAFERCLVSSISGEFVLLLYLSSSHLSSSFFILLSPFQNIVSLFLNHCSIKLRVESLRHQNPDPTYSAQLRFTYINTHISQLFSRFVHICFPRIDMHKERSLHFLVLLVKIETHSLYSCTLYYMDRGKGGFWPKAEKEG